MEQNNQQDHKFRITVRTNDQDSNLERLRPHTLHEIKREYDEIYNTINIPFRPERSLPIRRRLRRLRNSFLPFSPRYARNHRTERDLNRTERDLDLSYTIEQKTWFPSQEGNMTLHSWSISNPAGTFSYSVRDDGDVPNQFFTFPGIFSGLEDPLDIVLNDSLNDQELTRDPNIELEIEYHKATQENTCANCPICSENYKHEEYVSTLECGHTFHHDCILEWGKYKPECPLCRKVIPHRNA